MPLWRGAASPCCICETSTFFLAVVVLVLHKLTQAVAREMVINNAFSLQTKLATGPLVHTQLVSV